MKPDTNPNLDADYACMHNSFKACDFFQLHVIINFQNTFTTPHVGGGTADRRCGSRQVIVTIKPDTNPNLDADYTHA